MYASWLRISFESHLTDEFLEESKRSFRETVFQSLVKIVTRICDPQHGTFVIRNHWAMPIWFSIFSLVMILSMKFDY